MGTDSSTRLARLREVVDRTRVGSGRRGGRSPAGRQCLGIASIGLAGDFRGAPHITKFCRCVGVNAQTVGGPFAVEYFPLGSCATPSTTAAQAPVPEETALARSPGQRPNARQRRSICTSSAADAVGLLGGVVLVARRTVPGTTRRMAALAGFSARGIGWHDPPVAACPGAATAFWLRDQWTGPQVSSAGAAGDAPVSLGADPLAVRVISVGPGRTHGRGETAGRLSRQRPGVDGPRLLELRPVLADQATSSLFCDSALPRRMSQDLATPRAQGSPRALDSQRSSMAASRVAGVHHPAGDRL